MMDAAFTKKDQENLSILAKEIPRLTQLMDELIETLDVLGNETEMDAIKESLAQVKRGETRRWEDLAHELQKKGEVHY